MKLSLFNISNFRVDGGAMFGVIPKALWSRQTESDELNTIVMSLTSPGRTLGQQQLQGCRVNQGRGQHEEQQKQEHDIRHACIAELNTDFILVRNCHQLLFYRFIEDIEELS